VRCRASEDGKGRPIRGPSADRRLHGGVALTAWCGLIDRGRDRVATSR
jgi:hypothetical protein